MSAQRKNRRKRSFTCLILLKYVVILAVIAGVLFFSWKLFNSWKRKIWISGARFTVVVAASSPTIYSYSSQSGKIVIIPIPSKTQIDTTSGKWFAGSLWKLGYQEDKKGELLRGSLQSSLGLPIDGWIDEKGVSLFEDKGINWLSSLFRAVSSGGVKTNLDFFDRLSIILATRNVGSGDRRKLDLDTQGVLTKVKLEDGEDGLAVVSDRAKVVLETLHDELVFSEAKRVNVINASDKSGLASDAGRLLSTLGLRVIGTQNNSEEVKNCVVRSGKSSLETMSVKRSLQLLGCEFEEKDLSGPADIEVVLGNGFSKRF